MKSIGIRILILALTLCLLFPTISASPSAEESAIGITASCNGDSYIGGEITLTLSLSKPSKALAGIEFILKYDSKYVSPVVTESTLDGNEMDILVSSKPEKWEQMSYHSDEGLYHFRFAMPDDESSLLDSANELSLKIPFKVIAAGNFDFSVDDADIIAVAADEKLSLLTGNGFNLTVSAASEAQKLAISLSGKEKAYAESRYSLDIEIANLGDSDGIIAVEFALKYDKSRFKPVITQNDSEQMNSFMVSMPQNSWEQMCSLYEDEGIYILRFAAIHAESTTEAEFLKSGKTMSITVPFTAIGAVDEVGAFSVDSSSVRAINNKNKIVSGKGNDFSVEIGENDIPINPSGDFLTGVVEKTSVSDFIARFGNATLTDKNGKVITEGFVGTGCVLTDSSGNALTIVVRGDADGNGEINAYDYILVKRTYYETFKPSQAQFLAMALTDPEKITPYDYILVKRHFFGTIDLNKVN